LLPFVAWREEEESNVAGGTGTTSLKNDPMTLFSILSLSLLLLALAAIPSASVALVVTRSALHGVGSGVAVSAGIVLGDLLFATLALLGMTFLAEVMGAFFAVFKYLGGAYLIWLGIGLLRANDLNAFQPGDKGKASNLATSFLAGFILTLGDIKAILFYASLFPAFVDLTRLRPSGIALILLITVLTVGGVKLGYAFVARFLMRRLHNGMRRRWIRKGAGSLMIGSGAYLIART
jgi:threonine/homoserine/homoserine lactone efflux protein